MKKYEVKNFKTEGIDCYYTEIFLESMNYELEDNKEECLKNIKKNRIWRMEAFILNKLGFLDYSVDYHTIQIDILNLHIKLCDQFINYTNLLQEVLDEDNFTQVYQLAKFIEDRYSSNFYYIEDVGKQNEYSLEGITYYGTRDDDRKEVDEFLKEKISIIKGEKIEKTKVKKI